jgi:hypothetical protein
MDEKKKILFLCTDNAARSQMAEGFANTPSSDRYEAYSAGSEPTEVHPRAIERRSRHFSALQSVRLWRSSANGPLARMCDRVYASSPRLGSTPAALIAFAAVWQRSISTCAKRNCSFLILDQSHSFISPLDYPLVLAPSHDFV